MDETAIDAEQPPKQLTFVSTRLLIAVLTWSASVSGECIAIGMRFFEPAEKLLPKNTDLLLLSIMVLSWWTAKRVDRGDLHRLKLSGGKFQLTSRQTWLVVVLSVGYSIAGGVWLGLLTWPPR